MLLAAVNIHDQGAELGRSRNPSEKPSPSGQILMGRVPSEPEWPKASNNRVPSERGKNVGLTRNSEGETGTLVSLV